MKAARFVLFCAGRWEIILRSVPINCHKLARWMMTRFFLSFSFSWQETVSPKWVPKKASLAFGRRNTSTWRLARCKMNDLKTKAATAAADIMCANGPREKKIKKRPQDSSRKKTTSIYTFCLLSKKKDYSCVCVRVSASSSISSTYAWKKVLKIFFSRWFDSSREGGRWFSFIPFLDKKRYKGRPHFKETLFLSFFCGFSTWHEVKINLAHCQPKQDNEDEVVKRRKLASGF